MAGLKDLKTRLSSVKANKQITQAMQLVSTAKMKKSVEKQQAVQEYFDAILDSTHRIIAKLGNEKNLFLDNNRKGKKAFVVLSSDMGLCGGYNSNVIKYATKKIEETKEDVTLIVFGKKGVEKLTYSGFDITLKYVNVLDLKDSGLSQRVAMKLIEMYVEEEISQVEIIYTHFINALESEVRDIKLLPLSIDQKEVEKYNTSTTMLVEPDANSVLNSLVEQYLVGILYSTFINAIASEQTSRRNSMENATKNADELTAELEKVINRERQAKITQEISEIVSGSESLKS